MIAYVVCTALRTDLLHKLLMALALSSFELQKRYWYFWNQETKMHQLRGGHMGLGTKPILEATLTYSNAGLGG